MSETPPPPGETAVPEVTAATLTKSPSGMTPEEREDDRLAAEKQVELLKERFQTEKIILFTVS